MKAMVNKPLVCMSEADGVNFGKGGGGIDGMGTCGAMELEDNCWDI